MKRHTNRYITDRLRRIEWFVKAGRIEQARDALTLLKGGTCGIAGRLDAWAKRIAAIEESFNTDEGNDPSVPHAGDCAKRMHGAAECTCHKSDPQAAQHTGGRDPLRWLVVNPEGKLLAVLDSESEAYWFTRNRGHANGAVYLEAPIDYAAAPELLAACKAALGMFNDSMFIWGKDDDKKVCHMTRALARAVTKAAEGK